MNINIPGLRNSDGHHWQTIREKEYPSEFFRVNQRDWEKPDCDEWTKRIEEDLKGFDYKQVVLVGHSVRCVAILKWFERYGHQIKGALLVAPSDVDSPDYPKYIKGFNPMPEQELPFPSIVVASSNDHFVEIKRAKLFAKNWGSEIVELNNAGHIESKSGFGKWDEGLLLVQRLNHRPLTTKR